MCVKIHLVEITAVCDEITIFISGVFISLLRGHHRALHRKTNAVFDNAKKKTFHPRSLI